MTTATAPASAPAKARHSWTDAEKNELAKEILACAPGTRKPVLEKWAAKTGISPDSVNAQFYAHQSAIGKPMGKPLSAPRTARGTGTSTSPAERIERMVARREVLRGKSEQYAAEAKAMTLRIREAKKALTADTKAQADREAAQAKKAAEALAKAKAQFEAAQAKLAALQL